MSFTIPPGPSRLEKARPILCGVLAAVALGLLWATVPRTKPGAPPAPAATTCGNEGTSTDPGTRPAPKPPAAEHSPKENHAFLQHRAVLYSPQGVGHFAVQGSGAQTTAR